MKHLVKIKNITVFVLACTSSALSHGTKIQEYRKCKGCVVKAYHKSI